MSAFYVGQRVRIVGPSTSGLTGREATVLNPARVCDHTTYGIGIYVEVDADGWGRVSIDGWALSFRECDLAPLTPEGWQPIEWSECLWQPEGIAA